MNDDYNKKDSKENYYKDSNIIHSKYSNDINNEMIILKSNNNAVSVERMSRIYVILGWICAALTLFTSIYISPLFALSGIIFGILLNRQISGSGNIIIITNIVLALINIALGVIFIYIKGAMIGN